MRTRYPEIKQAMKDQDASTLAIGEALVANPGLKDVNAEIAAAWDEITAAVKKGDEAAKELAQAKYTSAREARALRAGEIPAFDKLVEEKEMRNKVYNALIKKTIHLDEKTKDLAARRDQIDKEIAALEKQTQ